MPALEDNHEDIIAKAMRGQKIGKTALADSSDLEKADIEDDTFARMQRNLKGLAAAEGG